MSQSDALRALYAPRSIAVIGASNDKRKFGGRPIDYMSRTGYAGPIYPVNPGAPEVQGHRAYADVRDIGTAPDLALVAVPAAGCVAAVRACAEAGVRAAVLIASGFAEGGGDGADWQAELKQIVAETGIRLLGPNCMGTANVHTGAVTTFATVFEFQALRPGGIAMASQSGAMGAHVLVLAALRGLGVHSMVTTGNECDIDVAECIAYLAEDDTARVITCYMEGCQHPELLRDALERARCNGKPVIALKVGATDVGAEAAGTHTAALAGSDAVFDAVLKMHGVHRARSLDELLQVASACALGRFPAGRRLGIVTVSGGGGVMAADAAVQNGLEVPPLPDSAQATLKALMPFAGVRNPVDTTAQVSNQMHLLTRNLEVILDEGDCDAVVIFLAYVSINQRVWESLEAILRAFRSSYPDAMVVCTGRYREADAALLESLGYLVVEDVCDGVAMVATLERFARSFERGPRQAPATAQMPVVPAEPLNEYQAATLLGQAGIPFAPMQVARSAEAAVAAAQAIDAPVAMKLLSPDVAHKSDIGGVRLGVRGAAPVAEAFRAIMAAAAAAAPTARIDGVLITPMAGEGVETILGVVMDPVFGPAVMLGLGGVFAEILEDVVVRPAPISTAEAAAMIEALKGAAVLRGARGRPPADLEALARAVAALSQFAHANRERLAGVDINPFLVCAQGAMALDALVVPRSAGA